MNIELNARYGIATVKIESGNTKIEEDLAISDKISDREIEQVITLAREMCNFNNISDVEFAKMIYDNFLSDGEQDSFKELINL